MFDDKREKYCKYEFKKFTERVKNIRITVFMMRVKKFFIMRVKKILQR
jgi:hypothetical protein